MLNHPGPGFANLPQADEYEGDDMGGASILEITKRGVANEGASVFKAFNADNN